MDECSAHGDDSIRGLQIEDKMCDLSNTAALEKLTVAAVVVVVVVVVGFGPEGHVTDWQVLPLPLQLKLQSVFHVGYRLASQ